MSRFNTVFLAIAVVTLGIVLPCVTAIQCDASMVGKTFPYNNPLEYLVCMNPYTSILLPCTTGTGYISNTTLTGCVPWELWTCTSKALAPACTADCVGYLFPTANPQNYYKCTGVGQYSLQSCPYGTGFNQNAATNNATVGCIPWAAWWSACPY